jgi:hypothetical protein
MMGRVERKRVARKVVRPGIFVDPRFLVGVGL